MFLKINFDRSCPTEQFFPDDEGVELAICGRSNSGKSSVLNMLANQKKLAKTSNTPGRTQSINFFTLMKILQKNWSTFRVTAMPKPQKKCKRNGANKSLNTWPPVKALEVLF